MQTTGLSWTGEFCLAMNDCGQYINEVGKGAAYDGTLDGPDGNATVHGDCTPFLDYPNYTDDFKNEMKMAALSYMDMSRNWLFWSKHASLCWFRISNSPATFLAWKVGANSTGLVPNPQWSCVLRHVL